MYGYVTDFHVIRPRLEMSQEENLKALAQLHQKQESRERLFKLGLGPEKIRTRGFHIPNYFSLDWQNLKFGERGLIFEKLTNELFEQFYLDRSAPKHLIHVSCTGYVAPSGAQQIVSKRGWGAQTVVSHAYHMGCYAALPALRMAGGDADIVHTELCSLHLNPCLDAIDQLVIQTLFADGFIKYTVTPQQGALKILAIHEEIVPDSSESMSWKCDDWGLRMFVAKEVPVLLARSLERYLAVLCKKASLDLQKVRKQALFAIHPGGPKIIEQIAKVLKLEDKQIDHSKQILRSCGNMSSGTLPHIWEKIAQDTQVSRGTHIVSLAFGPGLTLAGALFEKEHNS